MFCILDWWLYCFYQRSGDAAAAWDGKVNIEETAAGFIIGGKLQVRSYSEVLKIETMELVEKSYADCVAGRTAIGAFCRPVIII